MSHATILNIAAYHFVDMDNLPERRQALRNKCELLALKGSILLSTEGLNLFLAGEEVAIREFIHYVCHDPLFADLKLKSIVFKESWSEHQPFRRMLVKLKQEIIPLGMPDIQPAKHTSPQLPPEVLKQWLDEGREFTLLDTRNDYEYRIGTFEKATLLALDHFREFPKACEEQLGSELKEKPLVMFCTGGIRCEKASVALENQGYKEIYQLEGGILNYFEKCGGEHYDGDCFVFDQRVAVDPNLQETDIVQCFACQNPLSLEEQQSPLYQLGLSCPYCAKCDDSLSNNQDSVTV